MPSGPYPEVPSQPSFPVIEERVLARWADHKTFERSVEARASGANEYVFYDGPPFANGLPHYGHLLTGYVKDVVPRYQTMRGRRVERRFGWDCHGLPAEVAAEKELGVSGRQPVLDYGMERFNAACQSLVLRYTNEWRRYVTRQARWVDFAHDYKTMDLSYMESVMWAFKRLHEKGLAYEGYRVLPYCWECETPLSNFEIRADDAYQDRHDPAVTVLFDLDPADFPVPGDGPVRILAWTTTPWTLPSNLALAVGAEIDYSVLVEDGVRYVIGAAAVDRYERELAGAVVVGNVAGSQLVGRAYSPLFPWFADAQNAFRVLSADFVSTDEGTGVVHLAPGFGEDDQRVCEAAGMTVVAPVDSRGRFTGEVPDLEGFLVFDANPKVIATLKGQGRIVRHDDYVHSYPHCYRTGTPLIYKAVSSWFVAVTEIRDRLLANNDLITWVPAHVKDGAFGKWLENARDWSITRNRFWGAPIPVWKSDDPRCPRIDVYGSLDELERDFGVRPSDLHRPFIDELTRPNPDDPSGASTMRRVEDVLDCWFESGSMPYAQVHYPFENEEWFDSHFPADFIVEYIGQTRGWFYTLHVLATALFDKPPFTTCLAHGIVLGDDGRKASKSLGNYPDPDEVFDTLGADALRWSLMSSPVLRGGDLIVSTKSVAEAVRSVLNPIWNTWSFFTLYANTEGRTAAPHADSPNVLDRYLLAKTHTLVGDVTERMDAYDISGACASIGGYLDALTNWYVRRSRPRFWAGDEHAFVTLAFVLEVLCRLAAPLLPMVAEEVWSGLTDAAPDESVHLCDWPVASALPADDALVAAMDRVREVCSAASSIRKAQGLRVRLPLASLTVAAPDAPELAPFRDLIAEEVNVRRVELTDDVGAAGDWVLSLVPKVLGPRVGADVQRLIGAVKAGEWSRADDGTVTVLDRVLADDEYTLRLVAADEAVSRALAGVGGVVVLDTTASPELEAEGTARDVIRFVQQARKDAGLHVSDRIETGLATTPRIAAAVDAHRQLVMETVLAVELEIVDAGEDLDPDWMRGWDHVATGDLDGEPITAGIRRT
ncbi:MAG TPA: isoleucine--tRNA ligase [Acidimicrobiales bacterium]